MDRRTALSALVGAPMLASCRNDAPAPPPAAPPAPDLVLGTERLGFQWPTLDPFLFCVHHDDAYPAANERFGPAASLAGRNLGSDFAGKDGWRMYHGEVVPGFPQHPHRGFETVTIVRRGLIDHSDSLGAAARYGQGDVQWLTAGKGIVHSEMFPLLDRGGPNPLELFQIWLNLPAADKFAAPHFSMFWSDTIPKQVVRDASGQSVEITVIAGSFGGVRPLAPPPKSWAARPDTDVAIWTIRMAPRARVTLPAAAAGTNRMLYFFEGDSLGVGARRVAAGHAIRVRPDHPLVLENGSAASDLLLLQGRPIGEPVVQHGPFVMTTPAEIRQAFYDYQATRFGGWPWPSDDPVHGNAPERFARHADGRIETAARAPLPSSTG
ncbi:MAG TPA: pirin family protein [Polyangiaceae bacterium]|nr:pirin family protein [Polyangiaceae bacterium]